MTTSIDVREQASKLSAAASALQRLEAISARLAAIEDEKPKGLLPKQELGRRLAEVLTRRLVAFQSPRIPGSHLDAATQENAEDLLWDLSRPDGARVLVNQGLDPAEHLLDVWLFLLGPEEVAKKAQAAVSRLSYIEGPSEGERAAILSRLAAERAALVIEHADLVDVCLDAGVKVEHLPETREARDAEARAVELAAECQKEQDAINAELDAQPPRSRIGDAFMRFTAEPESGRIKG